MEYLTSIIFVPGKVSRGRVSLGDSNQAEGLSRTWGKLLQGNFGGKFWRENFGGKFLEGNFCWEIFSRKFLAGNFGGKKPEVGGCISKYYI